MISRNLPSGTDIRLGMVNNRKCRECGGSRKGLSALAPATKEICKVRRQPEDGYDPSFTRATWNQAIYREIDSVKISDKPLAFYP